MVVGFGLFGETVGVGATGIITVEVFGGAGVVGSGVVVCCVGDEACGI